LGKQRRHAACIARARQRYAEDPEYREKRRQYSRAYQILRKAELRARRKLRWASDPEYRERARLSRVKQLYGISAEQYAAMFAAQGGLCAICKKTDRRRLCVDHCHDTRRVGGLLCTKCNTGIGCFNDDPELLRAAIAYLERVRGKK
jgi:hypothetical protein